MELSIEQKSVHDAMMDFWKAGEGARQLTVGGYAGTGKTTLTAELVRTLDKEEFPPEIAFACYTGKASSVLRSKLVAADVMRENRFCGTIHSLMYRPVDPNDPNTEWRRVDTLNCELLIIDEASMVNRTIWEDITSYGIPIIAVGDHGQLPPIKEGGDIEAFNLMGNPQFKLEKIHRQAEDNPIIHLSMLARTGQEIPMGRLGYGVSHMYAKNDMVMGRVRDFDETLLLAGLNRSRTSLNKAARRKLNYEKKHVEGSIPLPGDKVVCLKNNRHKRIFNGVTGRIREIELAGEFFYKAKIDMDNGVRYTGHIVREQFGAERTIQTHPTIPQMELKDLFDFGYCLTVHKAQGSEADSVVLFEERFTQMSDEDWARWLYTGITRARKFLTIVNRRWDKAKQQSAQMDKAFSNTVHP